MSASDATKEDDLHQPEDKIAKPASALRRVAEKAKKGARRRVRFSRLTPKRVLAAVSLQVFSSLTRRIVFLNLAALLVLLSGILFLNQFRAGLTEARIESLLTQGEIISGAIAASASVQTNTITIDPDRLLELRSGESIAAFEEEEDALEFPINPELVAPVLRRLISPTRTRARIYDQEGTLILDSRALYASGQILRFDLPPVEAVPAWYELLWQRAKLWLRRGDLPLYSEVDGGNGRNYPEVVRALSGTPASEVRVTDQGELTVAVAVPIQRFRAVLGSLLLSTQGGDIDAIVQAERLAIFRVFLVAAIVTILLSILLASTIAGPMRRLAAAADRVRRGVNTRGEIPDFTKRRDEIGHLSQALRDMTDALFTRMAAIESFAADVSHELKNPLTSLRSAVETLPLAKNEEQRERLLSVILHDIRRLDRLISDISDASRLDAELARQSSEPVDLWLLLDTVVAIARETATATSPTIELTIDDALKDQLFVLGDDGRLGQVINNLLDNACSFTGPEGSVRISAVCDDDEVVITIEDDGPGIRPDVQTRIFERFYTDRPEREDFGQNSGLGLSISKQIVEAHRGTIVAQNWYDTDEDVPAGARFIVHLPLVGD
ncbi:sensor histidine kinase [Pararhizobium sp. IMCC21322]|uniref:sensor histidine kinase n=1 Tax=Pararhizobium sp. IMCC21322 TaxID=3067903 RepID=UPI0027427200|nr:sensor histidine kinase [Pararhizobium sp. IMCC21322]